MAYAGYQIATATGSITTQNLVPAGVATANSAVEITLNGTTTLIAQTTGTYTGALSLQGTVDGTTWVTLGGIPFLNINTGVYTATIASATQGIFKSDASAFIKVRLTALAAVTGTAVVSMRSVSSAAMVALDTPLPTGANTIGAVTMTGTTITSITPGTGAANFGKAEDAVHGSGDIGMMVLGVSQTTPAALGGIGDYEPFTVDPSNKVYTNGTYVLASSNGMLQYRNTALSSTGILILTGVRNLYGINIINLNTTAVYVKFYNKATAPAVGTDVPVLTFAIAAGSATAPALGLITPDQMPLYNFPLGLGIAVTTSISDADTTAPTTALMAQVQYA